jgi:hypothetical protein
MKPAARLKLFGMHNLLLEADLAVLEEGGIDIGHSQSLKQGSVVDTEVFEIDIRQQAKQMMGVYYLLFCLENSVRRLLVDRLREKHSATWWESQVPSTVQKKVAQRRKQEQDTPFSERSDEPIFYTDFRDLIDIIEGNWAEFSDSFRSVESVKAILGTLNVLRRPIAHNAVLEEDEIQRFKLHIRDWVRIQM